MQPELPPFPQDGPKERLESDNNPSLSVNEWNGVKAKTSLNLIEHGAHEFGKGREIFFFLNLSNLIIFFLRSFNLQHTT